MLVLLMDNNDNVELDMTYNNSSIKPQKKYLLILLVMIIALYVIMPQLGEFKSTPNIIREADLMYAFAAVAFTLGTYLAAAGTYKFLAFKRLNLATTTLVQFGAMFINRLLPGGIGALGANYLYLSKSRHTDAQALSVVALNNFLGFVGNSVIVGVAIITSPSGAFENLRGYDDSRSTLSIYLLVILVALLMLVVVFGRKRIAKFIRNVGKQLVSYKNRPSSLLYALFTSMLVTILNVLALTFCLLALGIHLPFVAIVLILSLGVGVGAATPTPGGLGGFEAGLVAGLVAYNINESTALAAALLYRFISYWMTLIIGLLAFYEAQRRKLFIK